MVGAALLWALEKGLGSAWTSQVASAGRPPMVRCRFHYHERLRFAVSMNCGMVGLTSMSWPDVTQKPKAQPLPADPWALTEGYTQAKWRKHQQI